MKSTKDSQTPKATNARRSKRAVEMDTDVITEENDSYTETSMSGLTPMQNKGSRFGIIVLFVLILLALGAYKYRYVLTPATVNGQPIYVWDYFWKLHTQYGQYELNSMTTEIMIKQAVAKANVSVSGDEINKEVQSIEQEASSSGGLQTVLQAQHMSMDEFKNRLTLQLAVKKILADKIKVTDQEVDDTYKKNKDFYKGMSEAQAREEVKKQLEDQKFQTEVAKWLSDVRNSAKVSIKFPGL